MKKYFVIFFLLLLNRHLFPQYFLYELVENEDMAYPGHIGSKIFTDGTQNYFWGLNYYLGHFVFDKNSYRYSFEYDDRFYLDFDLPLKMVKNGQGALEYYEKGKWSISQEKELQYLNLMSDDNYTYKNRLGILVSKRRLYLFDNNLLFFDSELNIRRDMLNTRVKSVRSSSYLTEGNTKYSGDSFIIGTQSHLKPWIEGVKGYGIGEWVEVDTKSLEFPVDLFLVSNGYVDFNKPYLYEQNSRIKKMLIEISEHDISFETELLDTPQLQEISLPKKINDGETTIRFTILEVYPGSKYDDTCLFMIVPLAEFPY